MKIAIYHQYLDNFGGGEGVALVIAEELSKMHSVEILTAAAIDKNALEDFFGVSLKRVAIRKFGTVTKKIPGLKTLKGALLLQSAYPIFENYDLVIDTSTNGWFTKKVSARTVCYIHYPFFYSKKKGLKRILNPLVIDPKKAFAYDSLLCNSRFTLNALRKLTERNVRVVNPPVKLKDIRPLEKRKWIVNLGRFSEDKKQDVLIEAFGKIHKPDYALHLIGTFGTNELYDKKYLEKIRNLAKGKKVHLHINISREEMLAILGRSMIYWHARGYGETNPAEYENFGIATVEAMAAGCIPIVINKGAQPEIVKHGSSGFCWDSIEELLYYTSVAIKRRSVMINQAIKESKKYSKELFTKKLRGVINATNQ